MDRPDKNEADAAAPLQPLQDEPVADAGVETGATVIAAEEPDTEKVRDGQQSESVREAVLHDAVYGELVLWRVFGLSDVFED